MHAHTIILIACLCLISLKTALSFTIPTLNNIQKAGHISKQVTPLNANILQDLVEFVTGAKKETISTPNPEPVQQSKSGVTLLEGNSWSCELSGVKVFVDPVFDTLDFGIPSLYKADRKILKDVDLEKELLETANVMLISQGLPDHCCPKTQGRVSKVLPESVKIIAPPSAAGVLNSLYPEGRVQYMSPGETIELKFEDKTLKVTATTGALVGPPWQANENGYLLQSNDSPAVYYEPHCMFDEKELASLQADYVITPVVGQLLPLYGPLVDGMEKSIKLAKTLKAKAIIPLMNGDLDAEGVLDDIISQKGSLSAFKSLLEQTSSETELISPEPGKEVSLV